MPENMRRKAHESAPKLFREERAAHMQVGDNLAAIINVI